MLFFKLLSPFHCVFLNLYLSFLKLVEFLGSICCKTIPKTSPSDENEVECFEQNVECTDQEEWESAGDGSQSGIHEEDLGFITFECSKNGDLVSDTISEAEALLSLPFQSPREDEVLVQKEMHLEQSFCEVPPGNMGYIPVADSGTKPVDGNNASLEDTNKPDRDEHDSVGDIDSCEEGHTGVQISKLNVAKNFLDDDGYFFGFTPPKLEARSFRHLESHTDEDFDDSFSVGSTSKFSSEPRSSIQRRDSMNEDPFSSSSRRSCPTWESFTAFQKYDEEMMFCDQSNAQKLDEPKLQKGLNVLRRSMSQKIVQKLTKRNKKPTEFRRSPYHDTFSELPKEANILPRSMSQKIVQKFTKRSRKPTKFQRSPYHELETAYVAEVCSAWEALSLNYKNFLQLRSLEGDEDPGYPAYVAQQFQQFQVLLQRFIENEPYEHGRRPEIYSRIKISSPKLLQVPEFRGIEKTEYNHQDGWNANISSAKFMAIMEVGIQTFMDFLKRDKEKHFQIFKAFVSRNNRTSLADPTLLHMLRKANKKKKKKIKDMCRVRKCLRKTMPRDEEIEILMGLVDLKVVSRVLKLSEISEQQLQWCEAKMSKVRFWEGKLERDSSPLPFPVHPLPSE